ncbi:MAG: tetratricopeptide repeat protein, partial [Acidobacteriota bacterium]
RRREPHLMAGTGKSHLREGDAVLRVEDLVVEFPMGRKGRVSAVAGISFDVLRGETLGIVGESGCGKSTTGRAIMQIDEPTGGSVVFEGDELTSLAYSQLREARTRIQISPVPSPCQSLRIFVRMLRPTAMAYQKQGSSRRKVRIAHIRAKRLNGRLEIAEGYYREALEIGEKVNGPEHPATAEVLRGLAITTAAQGKRSDAEAYFQRSLGILEASGGSTDQVRSDMEASGLSGAD